MKQAEDTGLLATQTGWRAETRATASLAWPIVLTNILQISVLLTNTALVGHRGADALAAVSVGSSLFFAVQPPIIGLSLAAAPLLAQARGAARNAEGTSGDWADVLQRSAAQALWAVMSV